jgi:hypothetical protein
MSISPSLASRRSGRSDVIGEFVPRDRLSRIPNVSLLRSSGSDRSACRYGEDGRGFSHLERGEFGMR